METALDQLVVSLSDIEMGAGGVYDDFPHTDFLAELIAAYGARRFDGLTVDLVFNGDTFDLLKVPIDGAWPSVVTEQVALAKLEKVIAIHSAFFEALGTFLRGGPHRAVHFTVGNHDQELLFEAVQIRIAEAIGADGVHFPGLTVDFGDLHIEHGSQQDSMFRVDPAHPFVQTESGPALALPWGTIALLEGILPLQPYLYELDRLKPRRRVFELVPEVRDLVVGAFWRYWTRDSWRQWAGADPVKKLSWTMLKEIAYRFGTYDPDVDEGSGYRDLLREGPHRVIVAGHLHQASWWSHADRKLLYTGCFRDEFAMDADGNVVAAVPKTYAEIFLREGRVVRSHLVEVDGPPPPPGHAPGSVFDVLPRIRPLLATQEERTRMREDEIAQEKREAGQRDEP